MSDIESGEFSIFSKGPAVTKTEWLRGDLLGNILKSPLASLVEEE